jgi:hypothetical protein
LAVRATILLLIAIRYAVFFTEGLRHSGRLIRLWLAFAGVVREFQRELQIRDNRILTELPVGVGRYLKLLFIFPPLTLSERTDEKQRLKKVLQQLTEITSRGNLDFDPLTAPAAIRAESVIVTHAFRRLFKLALTADQASILAQYGGVNLAAKDFLEYCGYGQAKSINRPLVLMLPSFVRKTELRHSKLATRKSVIFILAERTYSEESTGLIKRIKSVWAWVREISYRTSWSWVDARERTKHRAALSLGQGAVMRQDLELTRESAVFTRKQGRCMLVSVMLLHTVDILWDQIDENLQSEKTIDRLTRQALLKNAIQELEDRIKSIMPDCTC